MTARSTPKPKGIRRFERWFVGIAMTVVAFGLEHLVMRSVRKKGILALSMGGEVALAAAASDPRIAAVVSESAGVPTFQDMRAVEPPFTSASGWVTYSVADFLVRYRTADPSGRGCQSNRPPTSASDFGRGCT